MKKQNKNKTAKLNPLTKMQPKKDATIFNKGHSQDADRHSGIRHPVSEKSKEKIV